MGRTSFVIDLSLAVLFLVVVTGLEDDQVLAVDEAHKPVLRVDPPRPASGQHVTQRLRLADARRRIT